MKKIVEVRKNVAPHWVGDGFPVRSLFSYHEGSEFDPFLLLDYAGPYEFAPATALRGVGEHPHRGFETVTIVYQGELEHRDSAGNRGSIAAGDVQWMTAASGVVHEEFHGARFAREGGTLEMVQLWVNLPAREKLSPPRYQEILARQIPTVQLAEGTGTVRVIAGEFQGTMGPARTVTPVQLWDLRLAAGHSTTLQLADGDTALLVVQHGAATLNDTESVDGVALVRCERAGSQLKIDATSDLTALFLGGLPIGEPVVGQGPFVMNSRAEIQQAIADFQDGKMGRLS